jgi:hypothetical protein
MGGGGNKLVSAAAGLCLAVVFGTAGAIAQDDREHAFVLKMGPAGEWPSHERNNFGGTFAVEKSIIENWLEIEAGLTMLGTTGQRELSGDIIFKKTLPRVSQLRVHDRCRAVDFENAQWRGSIHHGECCLHTRFHVLANPERRLVSRADVDR